ILRFTEAPTPAPSATSGPSPIMTPAATAPTIDDGGTTLGFDRVLVIPPSGGGAKTVPATPVASPGDVESNTMAWNTVLPIPPGGRPATGPVPGPPRGSASTGAGGMPGAAFSPGAS